MLCSCKINRSVFKENIKKYTDVLELQNEQLHYSCLPVFTAKKKKNAAVYQVAKIWLHMWRWAKWVHISSKMGSRENSKSNIFQSDIKDESTDTKV